MPNVTITRANGGTKLTRNRVAAAQVFGYLDKRGKLMSKQYAHLGASEKGDRRLFSVNVTPGSRSLGELASNSKNGNRPVQLLGTFKFEVKHIQDPRKHRAVARSRVGAFEVFQAQTKEFRDGAKPSLYVHIGRVADGRYLAVNLNTREIATTTDGLKNVVVVGTATMETAVV